MSLSKRDCMNILRRCFVQISSAGTRSLKCMAMIGVQDAPLPR